MRVSMRHINATDTLVIVALAGTPAMFMIWLTPLAVLSGTGRLIVPELTVTEPGTGGGADAVLNCVPNTHLTPPHTGPGGVIVTTGNGLTVKVAQFDTLVGGMNGEQIPVTMQRYPLPLNKPGTGLIVSVAVFAPLYGAELGTLVHVVPGQPVRLSCHW